MRKLLLVVVLLALAGLLLRHLDAARDWVAGLGPWGPVALGGLYVLTCVAFVPGSLLTLAAGAAFGVTVGFLTVSVAATIGATLAFLVGRYLARERIARLVEGNVRFDAVDRAVGRQGLKIVLLTRLSPVFPFNVLNFAYGLTRVRVRDFVLGSWIGMMPGTLMYVSLGAAFGAVAEERERTAGEWALLGAGLLATIAVAVYVARLARRAVDEATGEAPGAGRDAAAGSDS